MWEDLRVIKSSMSDVPWLVLGDFNVVLNMAERSGFSLGMPTSRNVKDFQDCIYDIELSDAHSVGPKFTWCNNRSIGFIAEKLDRVIVNIHWLVVFRDIGVEFLPPYISDHCAGVIKNLTPIRCKARLF